MSQLRIAIDARLIAGTSTGDSSYWSGLLFGLSRIAPNAHFLLFSNAKMPSGIPFGSNFEWIELPSSNNRWWSMVAFPLAARKAGATVIHTQYNLSPLVGSRGVTTVHDVSFLIGPQWFQPKDLFILRRFIPSSIRRAKRVITVSETSKSEIARFFPRAQEKTHAITLACPTHIDPTSTVDVVKDFDLPRPYLLTVGTRWPRKNMQLAVDAAGRANTNLVVTGKVGWGSEDFPSHVKTTGYVDDAQLSALYRNASMYLAPSRHEGFGLPLLEAFACSCPVMCSEGGALPEVAGDAAVIVKSWRSSDWAQEIRSVTADSSKLADLRRSGLARVAEFSWEKTGSLTMAVYQEISKENAK